METKDSKSNWCGSWSWCGRLTIIDDNDRSKFYVTDEIMDFYQKNCPEDSLARPLTVEKEEPKQIIS
jgi:hypothetical protein